MPALETGFGWIVVDGERYEHDVVIHTDGTVTKRKKKLSKPLRETYGHTPLSDPELAFLKEEKPGRVYIGTGQYGDLPLTPEAKAFLKKFHPRIQPTPELVRSIGDETGKFAAIIHVTC